LDNYTICIEGPSAAGKTSLCKLLSKRFNIIAEVNELFTPQKDSSKFWYHNKQVERYQLSKASDQATLFDGDIFQAIWYSWVYSYPTEFLSSDELQTFYIDKVEKGVIGFPNCYFVITADKEDLKKRKENDSKRKRRNFDKHLLLIEPQKKYFSFIKNHTEIELHFVPNDNLEKTAKPILNIADTLSAKELKHRQILDKIFSWIESQDKS